MHLPFANPVGAQALSSRYALPLCLECMRGRTVCSTRIARLPVCMAVMTEMGYPDKHGHDEFAKRAILG